MIFSKPTKYGAGIEIYGDYQDLNSLRQTILALSDSPALNGGADEFVLGLAYEVRHAYEGARETSTVSLPGMSSDNVFSFQNIVANIFIASCSIALVSRVPTDEQGAPVKSLSA